MKAYTSPRVPAVIAPISRLTADVNSGTGDRMRHDFVDASAHRVEHQRRIQLRHDEQKTGRRVLALEDGHCGRKLGLVAQVENEHLRLSRSRLCKCAQRVARHHDTLHARLAQLLRELCVRAD